MFSRVVSAHWFAWAPLAAAAVHLFEEIVFPGGFMEWYRGYLGPSGNQHQLELPLEDQRAAGCRLLQCGICRPRTVYSLVLGVDRGSAWFEWSVARLGFPSQPELLAWNRDRRPGLSPTCTP